MLSESSDEAWVMRWRAARPWVQLGAFGLGVALAARGQQFCDLRQAHEALVYYGAAALVTVLGLIGSRPALGVHDGPTQLRADETRLARLVWGALPILLIVAASYPSLYWRNLEVPPGMMFDEGRAGNEALRFYAGSLSGWWMPGEQAAPAIYGALNGLLFRVFAPTLETFRSANATWTLVAAIALYLYVRRLGGVTIGLVTAVLFVHCLWVAHLSRWGFSMAWSMCGTALAFTGIGLGLARAADPSSARSPLHRSRWWPYAVAGFGAIFAQYGYISGRLVVPAVLATIAVAYVSRPRYLGDNWPGLLAMVVVFCVAAVPWHWALRLSPDLLLGRARGLSIHYDIFQAGSLDPLWVNLKAHLLLFNYDGDHAPVNNLPGQPLLHSLVAPVVAMGLVVSLYHWRALAPLLPLLWFSVLLWSGILSRVVEVPKAHRILPVAPVLFAALGGWLAQGRLLLDSAIGGRRSFGVVLRRITGVALVAWVGVHAYCQYDLYFNRYAKHPSLPYVFSGWEDRLYAAVRAGGPNAVPILDTAFVSEQFRFFTYFDHWIHFVPMHLDSLRAALPHGGPVQIYVHPRLTDFLEDLAADTGARAARFKDPQSEDIWWVEASFADAAQVRQVLAEHPEILRANPTNRP